MNAGYVQNLQYSSEPSIILPVPGLIGNPVVESIAKPAYPCRLVFDMAFFVQGICCSTGMVGSVGILFISKVDVKALPWA